MKYMYCIAFEYSSGATLIGEHLPISDPLYNLFETLLCQMLHLESLLKATTSLQPVMLKCRLCRLQTMQTVQTGNYF